jgi:hypothetical protein
MRAPGEETTKLFNTVTIKSQKIGSLNTESGIDINDVKDFQINVKAALIQATGSDVAASPVSNAASQAQLKALLGIAAAA